MEVVIHGDIFAQCDRIEKRLWQLMVVRPCATGRIFNDAV